jgi:type II secretory pathway pseudopilin PulG
MLVQRLRTQLQRGDTLIEVLFAFTILSLVIVGAMTIMNQGTLASQRSLETTLVRNEIDSQATTLRFLHDAYVAAYQVNGTYDPSTPAGQWKLLSDSLTATSASSFNNETTCAAPPAGSFILNGAQAKYIKGTSIILKPATTYAQVVYDNSSNELTESDGIWIEGIRSVASADANAQNTRYIDFHINACWDNPGQGPAMTIGTIVRLYEPRG